MAQTIKDLMTSDPATIEADATLDEAAKLMASRDIGPVLVTDGDETIGIITDRDIVVRAVAEGKDPTECKVRDAATTDVQTISCDTDLDEALRTMKEQDVRRLIVQEGDSTVGVISLGDIAVAREPDSALGDISEAKPNN